MNERQALLNGIMRQEEVPGLLYFFRTASLRVQAAGPVRWTLDGEFGGEVAEVSIQNCGKAFAILIPAPASSPAPQP